MSRKLISVNVLKQVVRDMNDVFTTKDVSEDSRVMNANRTLVTHSQYHAFVGGALSDHRQELGIDELQKGTARGSRWRKKESPSGYFQANQLPRLKQVDPDQSRKSERISMTNRIFDLNIEEVLENWDVEHALREVIANALDEQIISKTADIKIFKDDQGNWHIRDFGRGLKIEHFTLNENEEKLNSHNDVIGKFGVGLKDALSTFHRRGINVLIRSSFGSFKLKQAQKHGFDDIVTLHVDFDDTKNNFIGTDFLFIGVTDSDMAKAKSLFLKFANEKIIETNEYGQILERKPDSARVYIMGVLANDEPNFLFSYNITNLTDAMKKKLNRERLNVGRTTYTDRVKAILKNSTSEVVGNLLVDQIRKRSMGLQCDEMAWIDISQKALNLLHEKRKVVFFTEQELQTAPKIIDNVKSDGYEVTVITEQQKVKLETQIDRGETQIRTVKNYVHEYNKSFQYKFVNIRDLTRKERQVYKYTPKIISLVDIPSHRIPKVLISETMRVTNDDTEGVWDSSIPAIVIKRSKLNSLVEFAATLLHELGHATTNTSDVSRAFERVLTGYLGKTSLRALNR